MQTVPRFGCSGSRYIQEPVIFCTFVGEPDNTFIWEGDDPTSSQKACPAVSLAIEIFEKSLLLLKVSYEEPTVEDLKALNLAIRIQSCYY